ncbi:MAG: META domain-containing protein [Anaerolineae bacterium]|jgi:heat shock protein HslJ|nr:META domain-containing protein [Anaerolineae bacterium]MBT7072575.1 META domain-containing protein [Anaerolineae bacterium]MBT7324599.1 META domain-containing protein [Anaerolineae bacterium]
MKKNVAFLLLIITLLSACAGINPGVSLNDTTWELASYGPVDAPTPALDDVNTHFAFSADGVLKGNAGCNSFSGGYEISGNKLTTGPLMATLMGCESPRADQETAVFMLLNGTLTFESDGDILTIFSEDGSSVLNFTKADK